MRSLGTITLAMLVVIGLIGIGPIFPGVARADGMLRKPKPQTVASLDRPYQTDDCKLGWWQTFENGQNRSRWAVVCR